MDHSHDHHDKVDGHHGKVDGPWAGGWLVAVAAGLIAASLARLIGDVGLPASVGVGGVVFAVFGVLMGAGGVELTQLDAGDDHSAPH